MNPPIPLVAALLGLAFTGAFTSEALADATLEDVEDAWRRRHTPEEVAPASDQLALWAEAGLPSDLSALARIYHGRIELAYLNRVPREAAAQTLLLGASEAEAAGNPCLALRGRYMLADGLLSEPSWTDHPFTEAVIADGLALATQCNDAEKRARMWRRAATFRRDRGDQAGQLFALDRCAEDAPDLSKVGLLCRLGHIELQQDLGGIQDITYQYGQLRDAALGATMPALVYDIEANLALIHLDAGRFDDAVTWATTALQTVQAVAVSRDDPRAHELLSEEDVAVARALLAWALLGQDGEGDIAAARAELASIDAALLAGLKPRRREFIDIAVARLAIADGHLEAAEATFDGLLAIPNAEPETYWRAAAGLAEIAHLRGDLSAALGHEWSVVALTEAQSTVASLSFYGLAHRGQRSGLYQQWLADLAASRQAGNGATHSADPALAFAAGEVDDDLLLSAVDKVATYSEAIDLGRDLGSIERWIAELPSSPPQVASFPERIAHGRLSGAFEPGRDLRARLPEGVPVFLYHVTPDGLLILEARRDSIAVHRAQIDPAVVQAAVEDVARALANVGRPVDEALDLAGGILLGPIRESLVDTDQPVGFVLLGPLGQLPVGALRLDGRYLVETVFPFELPNLKSLAWLPDPSRAPGPLDVLGVAWPGGGANPGRPTLAWTNDELVLIDRDGYRLRTLTDHDANLASLAELAPAATILHVAAHGEGPTASKPGGARPPEPARIALADGDITPTILRSIPLNSWLVLLNACQTGQGRPAAFDGGVAALDRAGLVAGSAAAISTRWPVNDEVAYVFTDRFYDHLRTHGRAEALALAQRDLLANTERWALGPTRAKFEGEFDLDTLPSALRLSDPAAWAAWSLTGRWD